MNNKTRQRQKNQQHDEIINNHNQHARNAIYTRSNINTINRQEKQAKNLKHVSTQPIMGGGGGGGQFRSNFSRTHLRDATGNNGHRIKCFDQMLKLN